MKTFYPVKLYNIFFTQSTNSNSFKGHEFYYTFVTHFIPKSFFGHAKTTHFIPNTKKKAKIHVKVYNILSSYISITFTYPFHTQYKKKSFHYTFKGHELHTHFITFHLKGMNFTTHFILNTKKKKKRPKSL